MAVIYDTDKAEVDEILKCLCLEKDKLNNTGNELQIRIQELLKMFMSHILYRTGILTELQEEELQLKQLMIILAGHSNKNNIKYSKECVL